MAICKKCNFEFHACISCGIGGWEWDYCSKDCYKKVGEPYYEEPAYGQSIAIAPSISRPVSISRIRTKRIEGDSNE